MIKNGYGTEITDWQWLENELTNFVHFERAARMIKPDWTRHHLHKELKSDRILLSKILIVVDGKLNNVNTFNKGQRYFIHKSEIERLRKDVESRPKRKQTYCQYCDRIIRYCRNKPCDERRKRSPEYRKSVDEMRQFAERWVVTAQKTIRAGKQWYQGKISKKSRD